MNTNLDLQAAFDAEKKAKLQAYDFIITNGLLNDFRAFIGNTKDYSGEDYRQHINEMLNKLLDRLYQS